MAKNENAEVQQIQEAASDAEGVATDSVLAVSRHADGSPAQTPGFTSVAPEFTAEYSKNQLREQGASAADHAIRSAQAAGVDGGEAHEDPVNKALREAVEKGAAAGEKKAAAENY